MKAYQIMEEILEELSIFEDVRSTITNKYGPMFGDKSTPEGGRLHRKAIEANVDEIVSAAKRNLPDEEKNSMTAVEKEMGKIGARRNNTKNKIGEYRTRARNSYYRNFPVDWNPPKTDAEKAEGSIKRKFKKDKSFPVFQALRSLKSKQNSSEALDIMEEIIQEASIGALKRAVDNNYPKRLKNYQELQKKYNNAEEEIEKALKADGRDPNDEWTEDCHKYDNLYVKRDKLGKELGKAYAKYENADYLKRADLPDGKTNANKVFKAAKNSTAERSKEYVEAVKKGADKKNSKEAKRFDKSATLEIADPVKKRNPEEKLGEALSLAESIIGYADNIFELDYENKQNVNTNKIRKLKKDKDGENVEVVSVADELFPYEGNAKQQFNQKVLAKINDMIEGKGSLEDLIQFVRKYSGNKKATNESTEISEAVRLLEEMINEVSKETRFEAAKSSLPKREEEFSKVSNELDDLVTKNNYEYTGDNGVAKPKGWPYGNSKTIPEVENKIKEFRKKADRRSHAKDIVSTEGEGHDALMARDTSHRSFTTHQKRKNNAAEALEEIKQVAEGLFVKDGRGDLLNDIDNALGSPVKKTVKDMVKQCTGCKQKKVK